MIKNFNCQKIDFKIIKLKIKKNIAIKKIKKSLNFIKNKNRK